MVDLTGDEHLKDDERWARRLLEGTVGQTCVADRKGARRAVMTLRQSLRMAGSQR